VRETPSTHSALCSGHTAHRVDRGLQQIDAEQPCPHAYILPGAVSLNEHAFGGEPVVIYAHERLRWVNADGVTHRIVADDPDATDFRNTNDLPPGGEQSFEMMKLGTTGIHCADHPNMTGTLTVREH
jgi:plastocyanin